MMVKKGFTLSEVMVTLGVLGVLAAILVPAITRTAPDSKKVMFKKAYYTLEKAVSELINDDSNYPPSEMGEIDDMPVERGFNYQDESVPLPENVNKFCYLFSQQVNTIGKLQCEKDNEKMSFLSSDGILWSPRFKEPDDNFPLMTEPTKESVMLIDVNGDKGPNCGGSGGSYVSSICKSGVVADQYEVGIRYDGKLYVDEKGAEILQNPLESRK